MLCSVLLPHCPLVKEQLHRQIDAGCMVLRAYSGRLHFGLGFVGLSCHGPKWRTLEKRRCLFFCHPYEHIQSTFRHLRICRLFFRLGTLCHTLDFSSPFLVCVFHATSRIRKFLHLTPSLFHLPLSLGLSTSTAVTHIHPLRHWT